MSVVRMGTGFGLEALVLVEGKLEPTTPEHQTTNPTSCVPMARFGFLFPVIRMGAEEASQQAFGSLAQ